MIAVDTSALVAILRREYEADDLLEAIIHADASVLSAMTYLEASMVLSGPKGSARTLEPLDAFIARAQMEIAPFDAMQAQAAREAFLRFGKGRHPAALNFGDCAAYALAQTREIPLLYKGDDFAQTDLQAAV